MYTISLKLAAIEGDEFNSYRWQTITFDVRSIGQQPYNEFQLSGIFDEYIRPFIKEGTKKVLLVYTILNGCEQEVYMMGHGLKPIYIYDIDENGEWSINY